MKEQIREIDQQLRGLPLCEPDKPVWEQIAASLDRDDRKAVRRSRWFWSSAAALIIAFNIAFLWQGEPSEADLATVAAMGGPSASIYNTQQVIQVAALKSQIAQLDRLIPYGTLDEQLKMYEYRNELSDRLAQVSYQQPGIQIRL